MFRKIPSKVRETTVFQEFKKEFSPQFKAFEGLARAFLDRHAKVILCAMLLLIVVSFVLTVFVIKPNSEDQSESFKRELNAIPEGFGEEFSALQNLSSRAMKMTELKTEIERIIGQDSISKEDSAFLEKAIEQLQYFNNQAKNDEN
jgi:predicted Holliday junction resolvase-like endonuclease